MCKINKSNYQSLNFSNLPKSKGKKWDNQTRYGHQYKVNKDGPVDFVRAEMDDCWIELFVNIIGVVNSDWDR